MERIEKIFDAINDTAFGILVVAYFLGFIAILLAVATLLHVFHYRTRYAAILAAIVWLLVVFR